MINNAGIALASLIEMGNHLTLEAEKTLAVNTLGVVRVTKACLPLIRESKGRIVNVTSLASGYHHYFSYPVILVYPFRSGDSDEYVKLLYEQSCYESI